MRKARVLVNGLMAGILEEFSRSKYRFTYETDYHGRPVSLTMPLEKTSYDFNN